MTQHPNHEQLVAAAVQKAADAKNVLEKIQALTTHRTALERSAYVLTANQQGTYQLQANDAFDLSPERNLMVKLTPTVVDLTAEERRQSNNLLQERRERLTLADYENTAEFIRCQATAQQRIAAEFIVAQYNQVLLEQTQLQNRLVLLFN